MILQSPDFAVVAVVLIFQWHQQGIYSKITTCLISFKCCMLQMLQLFKKKMILFYKSILAWQNKFSLIFKYSNVTVCDPTPRHRNTELVSSGASLTSRGEGASLALVDDPSSDGVMIKRHYGLDVLHLPALHPIFSYWVL